MKINNDMHIGNDLKVGGIHVKDNGIVTRSSKKIYKKNLPLTLKLVILFNFQEAFKKLILVCHHLFVRF